MKNIIKVIIVALVIVYSNNITTAQEIEQIDFNQESHKEIGINFTQFVAQFIPFNIQSVKDGPIGYSFKRYNDNGWGFRFGLGANLSSDFDNSFFSIRLGYEKRRPLAKKFYYTRGWDLMLVGGSFNLPNRPSNDQEFGLGGGPVIGLEYHLTNSLILTTESMLFVGLGGEIDFNISILPPTALFAHFRF